MENKNIVTNIDTKLEPLVGSTNSGVVTDGTVVCSINLLGTHVCQDGEPYISFRQRGMYQVASIRSKKARYYIRWFIHEKTGEVLTDSALREFVEQIAAVCEFSGTKINLSIRTARDGEDIVVDGVNNTYRITKGSWFPEVIEKPIFKRPQGMLELATPVPGGNIADFLGFANITGRDEVLLFLVHLVASLIPEIPHPPLILYGAQGSSKSTILRMLIALLDPCYAEDVPFRNEKDFMLTVAQRWMVGMDNVSFIDPAVSDILCKLVTGACYTARVLYTDDDLYIRKFRRVAIINGINLPVEKPDFMDRCLLIPMDRIPREKRLDEATLNQRFEEMKGRLLGGCFDVLARAMEIYPSIKLDSKERMADFQVWGCAIAQALGYTQDDFVRAFAKNVELQQEEALEASPIAALVLSYFKDHPHKRELSGTPAYVFKELKSMATSAGIDERQLPRTPLSFSKRLQEVRPNLEAHGYIIDRTRGKERSIKIMRPKESRSASSASLPSVPAASYGASDDYLERAKGALEASKKLNGASSTNEVS